MIPRTARRSMRVSLPIRRSANGYLLKLRRGARVRRYACNDEFRSGLVFAVSDNTVS